MIEVEVIAEGWPEKMPWQALAERAAIGAITATPYAPWCKSERPIEIAIRLTDDEEVRVLNRDYRGKDAPTNVLSFPMTDDDDRVEQLPLDMPLMLGDIILAQGVCAREAMERKLDLADHVTHLIIHGVLHLLGFDHIIEEEALQMEALEQNVLAKLGLHNPYKD